MGEREMNRFNIIAWAQFLSETGQFSQAEVVLRLGRSKWSCSSSNDTSFFENELTRLCLQKQMLSDVRKDADRCIVARAQIFLTENKIHDAIELLTTLSLSTLPSDRRSAISLYQFLVKELTERKRYDELKDLLFSKTYPLGPVFDLVHQALILGFLDVQNVRRRFYFQTLEGAGKDFSTLLKLSAAACAVNARDIALESSDRLLTIANYSGDSSEMMEAHLSYGHAHLSAGALEFAKKSYNCALSISNDDVRAWLGLAVISLEEENYVSFAKYVEYASKQIKGPELTLLFQLLCCSIEIMGSSKIGMLENQISLLMFSHPTEKMKHNHEIAPPQTVMIEHILEEVTKRVSKHQKMKKYLLYDHRDSEFSCRYKENLYILCSNSGVDLITNTNNGLRRQWLDGFSRLDGEFVLIIEQDHELLPTCPDWGQIIDVFRKRPDINYIKINRDPTLPEQFDFFACQSLLDYKTNVTKTGLFSNTPHMMRRSFFENFIRPIVEDNRVFDGGNGGAAGIEENVNIVIKHLADFLGWQVAARLLGLTIWGNIGEKAVVRHLGY
ncbi:hypothetical protein [Acetobacter aceti]|uniref:hypothetical protein n=1 Tax=Acetobacter aceti TaxID=435 RepID=UPI000C087A0D|nr:hypothetical protein [Acetobacter aceti]